MDKITPAINYPLHNSRSSLSDPFSSILAYDEDFDILSYFLKYKKTHSDSMYKLIPKTVTPLNYPPPSERMRSVHY